jgi:hypothetical protein
MKNKIRIKRLVVVIIISLVAGISPCFSEPVPGGPGFVLYHASAFRPTSDSINYRLVNGYIRNTSPTTSDFIAPISLPHGATINKFVLYYRDNDSINSMSAFLGEIVYPEVSMSVVASITTKDSSIFTFTETTDISKPIVDNQRCGYYVRVSIPASVNPLDLSVSGFRIDYSYPTNLPLIMK